MYREFSGNMDINISHHLSGKLCAKKNTGFTEFERGQYIASKVEIRYNSFKGAQKWQSIK